MTTNKPEVQAYLHVSKNNPERRGVSLQHDASCTSTLVNTEPLIRLSDYEALAARVRELEDRLFAAGEMEQAPCFCCGYNGPGYYKPDSHPCAKRHHKLRKKGFQ